MATTTYGSPYVAGTDLVSGWPTASQNVANRIDDVAMKGNGVNAQSGAGYALVLTDAGKTVTLSNGSAQNLTVPLNSSVAFVTGTTIELLNIGAGTWTITGSPTITGTTSIPSGRQVRLVKTGTDTWYAQPYGNGGLVYITSVSASAGATLSVNSCFTSTYDNYRIVWSGVGSSASAVDLTFRYRVSAADNTTSNYTMGTLYITGGAGPTRNYLAAQNLTYIGSVADNGGVIAMDISNPFATAKTYAVSSGGAFGSTASQMGTYWQHFNATTSFDGFSLIPASGTITGTVTVFGYAKA